MFVLQIAACSLNILQMPYYTGVIESVEVRTDDMKALLQINSFSLEEVFY